MSMHIASLMKIPCYLPKLSSGNENMGMSRADNSVKNWRNLPIKNLKPDLHNIIAHTEFSENPLMFTQVIIRKRKTDGRTQGRPTWNHNTLPLLCGGYKNGKKGRVFMALLLGHLSPTSNLTSQLATKTTRGMCVWVDGWVLDDYHIL